MADIKTREVDRTPKIRDAAARLPKELIRDITIKSADSLKSSMSSSQSAGIGDSMTEDAGNRLESGMEWTADHGSRMAWDGGKKVVKSTLGRGEKGSPDTGAENAFRSPENTGVSVSDAHNLTDMDAQSMAIREKQMESLRIKTKEDMQTAREGWKSAGRDRVEGTGRVFHSPVDRIKSKSQADKLGKSTSVASRKGQRAYQEGKQLAIRGKQAAGKAAEGTKQAVYGVKTAVKAAVTAVRSAMATISAGAVVVLLVVILGVIGGIVSVSGSSSAEPLSQEVLAYTSTIQKYASQYGIPDYVASIQAIMMQESGGRGTDPMQASECPYNTRYPNSPGAIQDPEYSIQVGVQYYADCVNMAGCESPADMSRLQLSWQGYNYGNGYIGWALSNYGGYSLENALLFSQQQAAAHGWSGYGDPEYVPHVQRYYSGGNIFSGLFGNQQIVNVAKNEIGASNGEKYWRWYGFGSYQEWCACFVSWCGDRSGLIASGAMPKFSLCSDGMSWFQSHGKWQSRGSTPTTGSIAFFDWGGDGTPDHVAIVEKCENGVIYTIGGNTSTFVNGERVRGVGQHSYSIQDSQIMGYGITIQ